MIPLTTFFTTRSYVRGQFIIKSFASSNFHLARVAREVYGEHLFFFFLFYFGEREKEIVVEKIYGRLVKKLNIVDVYC